MADSDGEYTILPPLEAVSGEELRAMCEQIVQSGALGRSRVYASLLRYLVEATLSGRAPKEIEIAIDVLGRDASFDVSRDSVVRVYVHQLRRKLDNYYKTHEPAEGYRLVVPRGQYAVAVAVPESAAAPAVHSPPATSRLRPVHNGLLAAVLLVLSAHLLYLWLDTGTLRSSAAGSDVTQHPVWRTITDDDTPVMVVMGDYYIFGEMDEFGRIDRMIRDFSINSSQDLRELFMEEQSARERFVDLDMTYLPEGSAYALARIAPVLDRAGKSFDVTMMSRLSTSDLRNHHILYIGYISAMDKLRNLYFSASGLQIGRTYDELYNQQAREFYTSDAGMPDEGEPFRDLALLATFPAANDNQFLILAGARDAGLMHSAMVAGSAERLARLDESMELTPSRPVASYEAVYEVFGLDRMNFDANIIYTNELDPEGIWQRQEQ